jgi:hypothetical protein
MKSFFLEGLQSAREIVQNKGLTALDDLIKELENTYPETTSVTIKAETR